MGNTWKKTIPNENDGLPRTDEEQGLNQIKQGPIDPSTSNQNESEVEEQRLKELQDQLQIKQKELELCRAKVREKSWRQKIEEAEASLRHLNEEIHSANQEVIHIDDIGSATIASQERSSQRPFIRIDPSSSLSTSLQLAQWPLGYKFNTLTTYDG
jgi:hypothetical protein